MATTFEDRHAPAAAPPPLRGEVVRFRRLRVMKRRATGVLVAATALFLAVTVLGDDDGWVGYLRALAQGAMVGGLADWFAVTAIFRYPLGIPIPHTAVITQRKEQFGETLGEFVQENFLGPDVIGERVRTVQVVARTAEWLSERVNAELVAEHGANVAVGVADVLRDEDVHRALQQELGRGIEALPVAPLAGRALRLATAEDRHHEMFDAVLRGLQRALEDNRPVLRRRYAQESPWWLPEAVDDRIFDRLFEGACRLLERVNDDPDHELRVQFERWLADLAERLEHSPELQARVEQLKHEVLEHPELRDWSASLWTELKSTLRAQAAAPDSELRQRLADAVVAGARRVRDDPVLLEKTDQVVESGARYLADHFHDELAGLVSGTIARWDSAETSRRLELLLGPDLQFIRINGTVVGGLAGVLIHAVAQGLA